MARLLFTLVGGFCLGVLVALLAENSQPASGRADAPRTFDKPASPAMTKAVADGHRDDGYSRIDGMDDIVALPSSFARREALYALAGRADSARIQELIFDAHAVADEFEHLEMLSILFSRLGEMDPRSALALARSEDFLQGNRIERVIWRAWARRDLDDALFAAKAETSRARQKLAAQSLYSVFGYHGNEITDYIGTELGIEPDRSTRARYIYKLADRSPNAAIEFINGLESGERQNEYITFLADYFARRDPATALQLAGSLSSPANRKNFINTVNREVAKDNPAAIIDQWLVGGRGSGHEVHIQAAVQQLAGSDLDALRQYFEIARSSEDRQVLGAALASELAKKSPDDAMEWAEQNERGQFPVLRMAVLGAIAKTNPELALQKALDTKINKAKFGRYDFLLGNVMQSIAAEDPAAAAQLLQQIPDEERRIAAGKQFIGTWAYMDSDAAIDWLTRQDDDVASEMIVGAAETLLATDIDAIVRLLPRVAEADRLRLGRQIAQGIAMRRSPAEAQAFIQQFEGQPGYADMQASVVAGLAQVDVLAAKQLADQMSSSRAKDQAYQQIIAQHSGLNPQEAAQWLDRISGQRARSTAAARIATNWFAEDPVAAERWLSGLPKGEERDEAILRMSSLWRSSDDAQTKLILSISDPKKRGQAKIQHAYRLMRKDPSEARALLQDEEIPDAARQKAISMLDQMESGY